MRAARDDDGVLVDLHAELAERRLAEGGAAVGDELHLARGERTGSSRDELVEIARGHGAVDPEAGKGLPLGQVATAKDEARPSGRSGQGENDGETDGEGHRGENARASIPHPRGVRKKEAPTRGGARSLQRRRSACLIGRGAAPASR